MKSWLHPPESSSAFWGLFTYFLQCHFNTPESVIQRLKQQWQRCEAPLALHLSWLVSSTQLCNSATRNPEKMAFFLGRRDILKNQNGGLLGFNPPTWGSSISTLVGKTASKSRVESTFTPFLAASAGKLPWEAPLAKGGLCFSRAPCTTGGKNQIKTNKKMVHHTSQITNIYKR